MDNKMLTLWYLNSYRENIKETLLFNKEADFDFFKVKVNICRDKNVYEHYLNISSFNRTVLYGSTGAGKTYVLESILRNILFRSKKHCLYFNLKEYNGEDIFNLISKEIKYSKVSKEKLKEFMDEGTIVFIFDNYHILNSENKMRIRDVIFNNKELKNIKFIISSTEKIDDIIFNEEYRINSLSSKKVLKKILIHYCKDNYELNNLKKYINKYKLQSFLYRPVNLSYLLRIADIEEGISFIYNLKNEIDLYKSYVNLLVEDKDIVNVASYIAYYMKRKTDGKIQKDNLKLLAAEAVSNFEIEKDVDEILKIIKETIMIRSNIGNNIYIFEDENINMYLIYQYIYMNKIKMKDIILNRKFTSFLKWRCSVDAKFTYKNLESLKDAFIKDMLMEIEDKKVNEFYEYILLFFQDKVYDELMDKLNLIYQRFRWEDKIQRLTIEYLKSLNIDDKDEDTLEENRVVKFICTDENKEDSYKMLSSLWKKESENCSIIKTIYTKTLEKNNKAKFFNSNK
mgnify:FL=1